MKPLTVKSASTQKKNQNCIFLLHVPDTVCSLDSPYLPIFIFFSKFFPAGAARPLLSQSQIRISTFKTRKLGILARGKVYFLTMRNDVADLTVIKTHLRQKVGYPGSRRYMGCVGLRRTDSSNTIIQNQLYQCWAILVFGNRYNISNLIPIFSLYFFAEFCAFGVLMGNFDFVWYLYGTKPTKQPISWT